MHSVELGSVVTIPIGTIEVKRHFARKVNDLSKDVGDCMFDPGGACAGCLHLPEVVCRLFNNALSRILLYGGEISTDLEGVEKALWPDLASLVGSNSFIGLWDSCLD